MIFKKGSIPRIAIVGFIFTLVSLLGLSVLQLLYKPSELTFIQSILKDILVSNLTGGLTMLIVEWISDYYDQKNYFQQLLREISSGERSFAARAIMEMRANKWLFDGSLDGATFVGADLCGINLRNARFRETDLTGVQLDSTDCTKADFQSSKLLGASMRKVQMERVCLDQCILQEANLSNSEIPNSSLRYVDLENADLRYANLNNSDLSYANFRGADLRGASLLGVKLTGAILAGSIQDQDTLFSRDNET